MSAAENPSTVRPAHREAHAHASEDQPFHYPLQREPSNPTGPGFPATATSRGISGSPRSGSARTP